MSRLGFFSLILMFTLSAKGAAPVSVQEIDRRYESVQKSAGDLSQTEAMILTALKQADDKEPLTWRLARIYYALAKQSTGETREEYYQRCMERAGQTIELNDLSAWGFYYRGLCRGKLGQIQGIWSSLSMIKPLKRDFKNAARLDPTVSQGGPHRALGKLYLELPGFLGGSVDKSVEHLKQAVKLGPRFADNYLFLAEALFEQENYRAAKITLVNLLTLIGNSDNYPNAHQTRVKTQKLMDEIDPWIESQASHAQ